MSIFKQFPNWRQEPFPETLQRFGDLVHGNHYVNQHYHAKINVMSGVDGQALDDAKKTQTRTIVLECGDEGVALLPDRSSGQFEKLPEKKLLIRVFATSAYSMCHQ